MGYFRGRQFKIGYRPDLEGYLGDDIFGGGTFLAYPFFAPSFRSLELEFSVYFAGSFDLTSSWFSAFTALLLVRDTTI